MKSCSTLFMKGNANQIHDEVEVITSHPPGWLTLRKIAIKVSKDVEQGRARSGPWAV